MAILRDSETIHAAIAVNDAVLMGRRTFEMGDPGSDVGAFEFRVPIFVAAHRSPPTSPR
jgi:dihydrofolate reductase